MIAIRDPATNQPFPGNIIPLSRLEPASLAMLKFLPAATAANGQVFYSTPVIQDFDEFITRVDYSVSANDRLNYRLEATTAEPWIFPVQKN